jgi:ribonucleoside-diphosphate reductase beta chain
LQQAPEYRPVIVAAIEKYAPAALAAVSPPDEQVEIILRRHEDPWKTPRFALDSLAKKLKVIGLKMELPALPTSGAASGKRGALP